MAKVWITFTVKKTIWYYLFKMLPYKWFGDLIEDKPLIKMLNNQTGKIDTIYSLKSMEWRQRWT